MIFFAHDYETTGVNPRSCGVVQAALCFVEVTENGDYGILTKDVVKLNPGCPIPEGASNIHGIFNDDVADCDHYEEYLAQQFQVVNETDIHGVIGFNSIRFDDVIACRLGLNKRPAVDLYVAANRFKAMGRLDKANLSDTYSGLTEREPENAHDAFSDIVMTLDLIKPAIAVSGNDNLTGFMQWLNQPIGHPKMKMPFGKYKGQKLCNLPKGYVKWALNNLDLSADVKAGLEMMA